MFFGNTNRITGFQRIIDETIDGLKDMFISQDSITVWSRNKKKQNQILRRQRDIVDKYGFAFNEKSILVVENLWLLGYKVKNNGIWPDLKRIKPLGELWESTSLSAQERIVVYFAYYRKWIQNYSDKILKYKPKYNILPSRRNKKQNYPKVKEKSGGCCGWYYYQSSFATRHPFT